MHAINGGAGLVSRGAKSHESNRSLRRALCFRYQIKILGHSESKRTGTEFTPLRSHLIEQDILAVPHGFGDGEILIYEYDLVIPESYPCGIRRPVRIGSNLCPSRKLPQILETCLAQ